jgi:hypothetical protein
MVAGSSTPTAALAGHGVANQARRPRVPTPPAVPETSLATSEATQAVATPTLPNGIPHLNLYKLCLCSSYICQSPTKQEALQPLAGFHVDHTPTLLILVFSPSAHTPWLHP